jgi:starch phosphorylase
MAKLIIKAINSVAGVINDDPVVDGRIKVVFLPNFNVKNGNYIYPAADLSEQISTAGKEASGTGNMKFSMNGALTIGTLDGANVEIRDAVGQENFFLFGMNAEEASQALQDGHAPEGYLRANDELRAAIELLDSGMFSHGDRALFRDLTLNLTCHDPFLVLADYSSYAQRQQDVGEAWSDVSHWTRMSIVNVARMGRFSSDRSIGEYASRIWGVSPMPVPPNSV